MCIRDRVYRAYWVEGRDIGQIDVLCVLAADIGLNADEMRQALENRAYADDVKAAIQRALGIMREALKDYLPAWLISLLLSEMRF